jgi:hypothetical protein
MNRIRVTVLASVLAAGGLGLVASSAHAQAPSGAAPASAPRYYYGWGYNGWGYYYYPTAPTAPTYRGGFYSAPARSYGRGTSTSRRVEDYTGRHDGLARPWLRPLQ